jgi:hypothetical protein
VNLRLQYASLKCQFYIVDDIHAKCGIERAQARFCSLPEPMDLSWIIVEMHAKCGIGTSRPPIER